MKNVNISIEEIVDSIDCGVILLDQNKHILLWNDWIAVRTGVAAGEVVGRSILTSFNEPSSKQFATALSQAFTSGTRSTLTNSSPHPIFPLNISDKLHPNGEQTISVKMLKGWTVEPLCMIQITDSAASPAKRHVNEHHDDGNKVELDLLTNLYTRRFFDEYYRIELGRLQRLQQPFFLLMLDVDCFKKYNENYGEEAGDVALIRIAYSMRKILRRTSDVIARYGGEEFIFLLRDTTAHGAQITAEKLRKLVSNLEIEHDYSGVEDHMTVSIGVVGCDPQKSGNVNQLIDHVQLALQNAKNAGRNQVCYVEA